MARKHRVTAGHAQTMQAPPLQWTGSGPARPWTFCSGALLVHKELP